MSAAAMVNGHDYATPDRFLDFTGLVSVMGQMEARLHAIDPLYKGGSSFGIGDLNSTSKVFLGPDCSGTESFSSAVRCGWASQGPLHCSHPFSSIDSTRREREQDSAEKRSSLLNQNCKGKLRPMCGPVSSPTVPPLHGRISG